MTAITSLSSARIIEGGATMNEAQRLALDKINGAKYKSKDANKEFVFPYVRDILVFFVNESPAFAEAVNAQDKTLDGCIDSLKLVGKRTSDLDVYKECVAYFLPEAVVEYKMTIRIPSKEKKAKILDFRLEDFL